VFEWFFKKGINIVEVMKMAGVFDKFQKEENDKMVRLGARIMKMYLSGESIAEIAKQTNLTEQELEEIFHDSD